MKNSEMFVSPGASMGTRFSGASPSPRRDAQGARRVAEGVGQRALQFRNYHQVHAVGQETVGQHAKATLDGMFGEQFEAELRKPLLRNTSWRPVPRWVT